MFRFIYYSIRNVLKFSYYRFQLNLKALYLVFLDLRMYCFILARKIVLSSINYGYIWSLNKKLQKFYVFFQAHYKWNHIKPVCVHMYLYFNPTQMSGCLIIWKCLMKYFFVIIIYNTERILLPMVFCL